MELIWEYTFPLPFLAPVTRPSLSAIYADLQKGADGFIGIGITTYPDRPLRNGPRHISFFEIDLARKHVTHCPTTMSFRHLTELQLCYDDEKSTWLCEMAYPVDFNDVLEIYQINPADDPQWVRCVLVEGDENIGWGGKLSKIIWSTFPKLMCVFGVLDIIDVNDAWLYWATWSWENGWSNKELQEICSYDAVVACVTEQGCLLLLYQRMLDEYLSPSNDRTGSGTWQLSYRAYNNDGHCLHQEVIPQLTTPIRHTEYPESDFWKAFHLSIVIENGPLSGAERQSTSIVSIVQRELAKTLKESGSDTRTDPDRNIGPKAIGRLLWIDQQGCLLDSQDGLVGEEVTLCCCGEQVVGAQLLDGEWQLWHWFPGTQTGVRMGAFLPAEIKHVTVMAQEPQINGKNLHFWCIEEYTDGIRVVRRECEQGNEVATFWREGILLLEDTTRARHLTRKCVGTVLSEDRLVLLGIDQDETLKLLCFQ